LLRSTANGKTKRVTRRGQDKADLSLTGWDAAEEEQAWPVARRGRGNRAPASALRWCWRWRRRRSAPLVLGVGDDGLP